MRSDPMCNPVTNDACGSHVCHAYTALHDMLIASCAIPVPVVETGVWLDVIHFYIIQTSVPAPVGLI